MPLITISRNLGCGGTTIARLVAQGLDLQLYDDQKLQEEAVKMGVRSEELEKLDERAPRLFDRILGHRPELYLDLMEAVVYEVARRGHGVILGHGSPLLLRDFGCALHVRVHASESSRIQHIMDQQGLTRESAEKLIHKSDNERRGFFRFAFHKDWNDPSLYDLIINTEKMSTDLAANLIMEAARSQEIKECSLTAVGAMEDLALVKKIEAALLKNNLNISMLHVEVPEKGLAYIRGWTYEQGIKERVLDVVKGVPEVSEVRSEIAVLPAGTT